MMWHSLTADVDISISYFGPGYGPWTMTHDPWTMMSGSMPYATATEWSHLPQPASQTASQTASELSLPARYGRALEKAVDNCIADSPPPAASNFASLLRH
jgi:hypothetical protein